MGVQLCTTPMCSKTLQRYWWLVELTSEADVGLLQWISDLLAPKQVATPVPAQAPAPVASRADWHLLCTALCKAMDYYDVDGLWAEVVLALEQPGAYFAQFEDDLGNRGIEDAAYVTTWLALVDGLQRRDLNVEMDWKMGVEELVLSLATLRMAVQHSLRFGSLASGSSFGEEALMQTSAWLRAQGMALVSLDIQSDCYPLSLVPVADVEILEPLVKRVGERLIVL